MLSFRIDEHRGLRLLEETDANELYAVVDTNRKFLAQWMPLPANQTLEGTLEFIRSGRRQLADNQGFHVAIVNHGGIVGVVGFHRLDWENRSTSVGYLLDRRVLSASGNRHAGCERSDGSCLSHM